MSQINLDEWYDGFAEEVAAEPGGEGIRSCYACGTCSAGCPVRRVNSAYNPRKIIRMILLGMKSRVLKSDFIWLCSSCYACQERCPQGVSITDFMTLLKNMAVQAGHVPAGVKIQKETITGQGRIYAIDEFDNKKRNKIDLPSLPTSCEAVKDLFSKG